MLAPRNFCSAHLLLRVFRLRVHGLNFRSDLARPLQGPYAKAIFLNEFGAPPTSLINADPKEDFGGHSSPSHGHADPNLTHAVELVAVSGRL